jgi:hypothetical protein
MSSMDMRLSWQHTCPLLGDDSSHSACPFLSVLVPFLLGSFLPFSSLLMFSSVLISSLPLSLPLSKVSDSAAILCFVAIYLLITLRVTIEFACCTSFCLICSLITLSTYSTLTLLNMKRFMPYSAIRKKSRIRIHLQTPQNKESPHPT